MNTDGTLTMKEFEQSIEINKLKSQLTDLQSQLDKAKEALRPEWSDKPPIERGWYWHWNGDPYSAPFPLSVMFSGLSGKCFVASGQGGITQAIDCDIYGGFWIPLNHPDTSGVSFDRIRAEAKQRRAANRAAKTLDEVNNNQKNRN